MNRSLYIAATGMNAQQSQMDVISNNLASGSQIGTGVQQVATERLYTQGNLQQTGNSKDVAINGNGFFQVQMPDGTTAYTRDGSFQTNAHGQLVTSSGYQVIPAITNPQNALQRTIGTGGPVSITPGNSTVATQVGSLQRATFINPAGLDAQG